MTARRLKGYLLGPRLRDNKQAGKHHISTEQPVPRKHVPTLCGRSVGWTRWRSWLTGDDDICGTCLRAARRLGLEDPTDEA